MDLGLSGRRALVLGGSRGLGAALAARLMAEGADVTVAARSAPPAGAGAHVSLDLADRAGVAAFLAGQAGLLANIDILVLNGGGPPRGDAASLSGQQLLDHAAPMLAHQIDIARAVLPGMRSRQHGRILAISSTSIMAPIPDLVLSSSLRAALAAWCKSLASEVAADGITVNLLLPGRIATERINRLNAERAAAAAQPADTAAAEMAAQIPIGRLGQPEEFADVAAFLASARASYVTGTAIRIDGGLLPGL